jgi:hypothetical protein
VNNTLEVERTANVIWNLNDAFEFDIVATPQALENRIKAPVGMKRSAENFPFLPFNWPRRRPAVNIPALQVGLRNQGMLAA